MTFQQKRKYIHPASAGAYFIGEYCGSAAKSFLGGAETVWLELLVKNARPPCVIIKTALVSGIQTVGVGISEA